MAPSLLLRINLDHSVNRVYEEQGANLPKIRLRGNILFCMLAGTNQRPWIRHGQMNHVPTFRCSTI
jgi:hypothetical protein